MEVRYRGKHSGGNNFLCTSMVLEGTDLDDPSELAMSNGRGSHRRARWTSHVKIQIADEVCNILESLVHDHKGCFVKEGVVSGRAKDVLQERPRKPW
jgi:hypothetical protein